MTKVLVITHQETKSIKKFRVVSLYYIFKNSNNIYKTSSK